MLDMPDMKARQKAGNHAEHKAKTYMSKPYVLFIESDVRQAAEINRISGKPVLCTANFQMIFDAESVIYNLRSGKYLPFLRRWALKTRDWIRN
jgi:hypothetical protein